MRRPLAIAAALAVLFPLGGCQREEGRKGRIALVRCRLEGLNHEALCGTWEVFEDRAAKAGRKISLNVAVVPALARDARPDPVFILAGGPGQAATEVARAAAVALDRVQRKRDLVFVDQRGTGKSNPLGCELVPRTASLGERLSAAFDAGKVEACARALPADLRLYTTPLAMDDLDEVREALGYRTINLFGGSYGTRAGLVYLRQHPDRVRAAVLDGLAPTHLRLPLSFARDGQRALDLLFAHCENDAACDQAFPNLGERFRKLLARLEASPLSTTVRHPATGAPEAIQLSRDAFAQGLRTALYSPERAALIPWMVHRLEQGDAEPFVALAAGAASGFEDTLKLGMFFSVICAEDATQVAPGDIDPATAGTFLGRRFTDELLEACRFWPRGTVPPSYFEPVRSDRPVLLLSGDLDPVTPPAWADEVGKTLSRSLHLTVPGVGHGAAYLGCMPRLIDQFLERADTDLDAECLRTQKRPPFVVSFAGPTP